MIAAANTRRGLLVGAAMGAAALALAGCATTGGTVATTLATVQGYAATAYATLVSLAAIPALSAELTPLLADAKAAESAVASLTAPSAGDSDAQTLVSLVEQGLTIAAGVAGLSPDVTAAIAAAEVLIPVISSFFGVTPTPAAGAALGRARLKAMVAAANLSPAQANAQLVAWLATQH